MRLNLFVVLLCLLALQNPGPCRGEDEIVGTVTSWSGSRVKIQLPSGYTRELQVTGETRFFNEDSPVPQRRILPHTRVRVAPKDGRLLSVTILGAPR